MSVSEQEIAPGICLLAQRVDGRRLNFCALTDDDGLVLLDVGLPGSATSWLDRQAPSTAVTEIWISHADADHLGDGHAVSRRHPEATIIAHAADREWIEHHDRLVDERYDGPGSRFGFHYDRSTLTALREACGPDFKVHRLAEPGAAFSIGNRVWEVLHVPGHSPGHLALWSPSDGVLWFADAVLGFGVPTLNGGLAMPPTHQNIEDYLRTVERLSHLPVQLAVSGHWPVLDGPGFRRLLEESRCCIARDLAFVRTALRERHRATFRELHQLLNATHGTWPASADVHYFYALSGYIEWLEARREVRVDGDVIERLT